MKTRTFRNGRAACRSYLKPVGRGWEVGFFQGTKPLFIGNFIHRAEANQWYTRMNREIRTFSKRYKVGKTYPQTWYTKFLSGHLYNTYYKNINKFVNKHNRNAKRIFNQGQRKYNSLNRRWISRDKHPALKAA